MKIVRFSDAGNVSYGCLVEASIIPLPGEPFSIELAELSRMVARETRRFALNDVKLLAPCTPSKYIGFGMNYRSIAESRNRPAPSEPFLFLRPSTSIIGPFEPILLPAMPHRVIEEGELAVVISRRATAISAEEASDHIFGYTITNDVTDLRQLEPERKNFAWAKARDHFGPLGPWIVTDLDPANLSIVTRINGDICQSGSTAEMFFDVFKLVAYASSAMTLLPGDVIATGTPDGARALAIGDRVEIEVEGIGTLFNPVCAASDALG